MLAADRGTPITLSYMSYYWGAMRGVLAMDKKDGEPSPTIVELIQMYSLSERDESFSLSQGKEGSVSLSLEQISQV